MCLSGLPPVVAAVCPPARRFHRLKGMACAAGRSPIGLPPDPMVVAVTRLPVSAEERKLAAEAIEQAARRSADFD